MLRLEAPGNALFKAIENPGMCCFWREFPMEFCNDGSTWNNWIYVPTRWWNEFGAGKILKCHWNFSEISALCRPWKSWIFVQVVKCCVRSPEILRMRYWKCFTVCCVCTLYAFNCTYSNGWKPSIVNRDCKQVCAAEMAVRYAALSVSLLFARWRQVTLQNGTHGTDRQTDGQTECDAVCGPLKKKKKNLFAVNNDNNACSLVATHN